MSLSESTNPSNILYEKYHQIAKDGSDRADCPKDARIWITSFGNFERGTQVSKSFLSSQAYSLLPILTSWLQLWFQRTQKARDKAKNAVTADDREKMMSMQYHGVGPSDDRLATKQAEEENLQWLFDYIFDYLGLSHDQLPPDHLVDLCKVLLNICQSTLVLGDIEGSTRVIYEVIKTWHLPEEAVQPVLEVLCLTRMSLSRSLPSRLEDSITLLVTGDSSKVLVSLLLSFIRNAGGGQKKDEAITREQRLARGSILFLTDVVKEKDKSGVPVVEFTQLIDPLQAASCTDFPRSGTEILDLCDRMLLEPDIRGPILANIPAFLHIVENCCVVARAKAVLRRDPSVAEQNTVEVDERKRLEQERHERANLAATSRVKQSLVVLWKERSLSEDDKYLVYRFIMATPDDTDESTLTFVLQYAQEQKLCYRDDIPQSSDKDEISRILEDLVRNKAIASKIRNKAIDVVDEASRIPTGNGTQSGNSSDIPNSAGSSRIVDALFMQLEIEEDSAVSNQIAKSLQQTAIWSIEESDAQPIVARLEKLVLRGEQVGTKSQTLIAVTQSLIEIVLQASNPKPSFEALLKIASIDCKSTEARIEAFRLLFRLRCNSNGTLYVQDHADSDYIAAALCRTRESFDSFSVVENAEPQRKSGSSLSLSTKSNTSITGWMYPETESFDPSQQFAYTISTTGYRDCSGEEHPVLDMGSWLITMAECLQRDQEWETYSFLIVHAGAQLANTSLFSGSDRLLEIVVKFRQVVCERIGSGKVFKPPASTGLKDSDVAICLFNVLTALIPYATIKAGPIQKGYADELVKAFLTGVGGTWEGTSRGCIHALSICCLEVPASVASSYPTIVDRMSRSMTQAHLSMHILEFLSQVARLPDVHSNFQDDEIMMIFSICIQFLERARERPTAPMMSIAQRSSTPAARQSGLSSRRPPYRAQMLVDLGLSQYNSALVYHVMIFWFLSLKLSVRAKSIKWIIPRLVWKDKQGEEHIDEQSMVFIDMMQRTAYSDLGETVPHPQFAKTADGKISSASWVVGQSIITIETAGHTGLSQITKRQASGTTHAIYQQHTAELPSHHVPVNTGIRPEEEDPAGLIEMLPSHVLLQMAATADPVSFRKQPVLLVKDDVTRRAIESFDRLVTVDSHKLGIMYIGPGQVFEKDYLANTSGGPNYHSFLNGMGTRVSLAPPLRYNPQGLQNGIDGTETYAWRDRITEIVFHVPTMMPTNTTDDPGSTQKKSHVGNCHVNIIYNRSGLQWDFGNFASQLNYVNIVVEPVNKPSNTSDEHIDFFCVQTLTAPQFPSIGPASDPKIISAAQLPQFVRMVALNANVFCQAWNVRDSGDSEFPSSWRARLQAIKRLREKVVSKDKGTLPQQLDFSGFTLS
jgi:Rap/ran-GAP/Domain of unknown function (DUF3384)/Tuberin